MRAFAYLDSTPTGEEKPCLHVNGHKLVMSMQEMQSLINDLLHVQRALNPVHAVPYQRINTNLNLNLNLYEHHAPRARLGVKA